MYRTTVADIRDEFGQLLNEKRFTSINREATMTSIVGSKTIEIIGANFIADSDVLFGEMNWDYVHREEKWYKSMSRSIHDFTGGAPAVWQAIASKSDGIVNSNYGWCIYSLDNYSQFVRVVEELKKNPESRRAVMIYTRPSMWIEYDVDGRSDFMCTNVVQYVIRGGKVHSIVQMRSNDALIGYKNDRAWQRAVLCEVAAAVGLPPGDLHWQVGSLHVYERNFYLVDHFWKTGALSIAKARYDELYPDSPYASVK